MKFFNNVETTEKRFWSGSNVNADSWSGIDVHSTKQLDYKHYSQLASEYSLIDTSIVVFFKSTYDQVFGISQFLLEVSYDKTKMGGM